MPSDKMVEEFFIAELKAIKNHRDNGGLVAGCLCRHFPPEILAGLGLWPLRLTSGADFNSERRGEQIVRPDACSYCKSTIGCFKWKTDLHGVTDILVGVITCDMMRRTIDTVETEIGIPVFRVNMPATRSVNAESYFVMEVHRAVEELERFLKRKFDATKCISYFNDRKKAAEIIEDIALNNRLPPVLTHKIFHLFSIARPETMLAFLRKLKLKISSTGKCRKIILTGSTLCLEDVFLIQLLQENDISVIPFYCTGLGAIEIYRSGKLKCSTGILPVRIKSKFQKAHGSDVIKVLALLSFNSNICIRQRPNIAVYDRLKEIIKTENCDGVILKSLKFCDLWFSEKERMKQELGVPLLVLDTTYSDSEKERIRNRVEAFLEII
ncbi:MAG: 2-hydroxyacyl-CoA dehydratase family protein [Lentisphaerae bacterium]|nr:2-hydroxyacyl-CoA dehydratase family protein [Lentisphaerota bacterium]